MCWYIKIVSSLVDDFVNFHHNEILITKQRHVLGSSRIWPSRRLFKRELARRLRADSEGLEEDALDGS